MIRLRRNVIRLRSHHLKAICSMLKARSPETYDGEKEDIVEYHGLEFWQNLETLYHRDLKNNPKILIVQGLDDICRQCPHNRRRSVCRTKESEFINLHNLKTGKVYRTKEVFEKLLLEEHTIREYFESDNNGGGGSNW